MSTRSTAARWRPWPAGLQRVDWDRRDGAGTLLPPGLYLLRLAIQSDAAALTRLVPVGVAH